MSRNLAPGVVACVACDACDELHEATVQYFSEQDRYGWHCPSVGIVEVDANAVAALSFSIERIVRGLAGAFSTAFGGPRWRSRPIECTSAWIVATFKIGAAATTVILASGLSDTSAAQTLVTALQKLPQNDAGLILVTDDQASALPAPSRFRILPLQAAVCLQEDVPPDERAGRVGRPSLEAAVWHVLDCLDVDPDDPQLAALVKRAWSDHFPGENPPGRTSLRKHTASWWKSRADRIPSGTRTA
jgi:hypothetical protein